MFIITFLADNLYAGLLGVWWIMGVYVPHYSWAEYGGLLKGFLWLIPARIAYGVFFPEKVVIKQAKRRVGLYRRSSKVKPSKTDHQLASAAIFNSIHH